MSLKSFLQMQEGGQTFVSPFAQPAPKGVTPRQMPGKTFEEVTGIYKEKTPTTITIGDPPDITKTPKEKEPEIFDPGVSGISAYGYTAQSPEVIAASTALGIPLTGFETPAFYDSLVAMNQPETSFSKGLDTVFGKGLQFAAKGIVGAAVFGSSPLVAAAGLGVQRALSGKPIFGTSEEDTPATTSKATTPSTATKTTIPKAMEEAIGRINQQIVSNAPPATPASVGADIFGPAYGQGGEISPNFAIGGKGSFTSFSHYSAGVSQADEASMISKGINSGVFADSQSGKDTIDAMVEGGHSENVITAVATGQTNTAEITALAEATGAGNAGVGGDGGGGGDGPSVICQELYDQGLLEHSIYSLDEQFGEYLRKHDLALLEGYHAWAYNVVNAMRKSKTITHIVRIVSRPVVKHIAYKMGHPSKTLLGAAMFNVGAFICRRLAKKEIVYA
jgi:hypothetical protein